LSGATSPQPITGLINGTTYHFVVTAENGAGESVESAEVSATPSVPVGFLDVVSVNTTGLTGNGPSPPTSGPGYWAPALSDDGRIVAFTSSATDLVIRSLVATPNAFVRETLPDLTQNTTLESVALNNDVADGPSYYTSISGDGRYLVFRSAATNLDNFSTCNANGEVFRRDRNTGETLRVTVYRDPSDGRIHPLCNLTMVGVPAISADGRYVAYSNGGQSVYLQDSITLSYIDNIGAPPPGPGNFTTDGSLNPVLSGDGSLVAFVSDWNLDHAESGHGSIDVFLFNRNTGNTVRLTTASGPGMIDKKISMSRDGRYVAYASIDNEVTADTNHASDIYVREMLGANRDTLGPLTLVSIAENGALGNSSSFDPSMNSTGSIVAFTSYATNLVPGDTNNYSDVFVRDIANGMTKRISVSFNGAQGNANSGRPAISPNGTVVGFVSYLDNFMVPGMDTNNTLDTFIAVTGSPASLIPR
jgi:Tol biopolymer transport system component